MNLCKLFAIPLCGAIVVGAAVLNAQERQAQPTQPQPQAQPQARPIQVGQRPQWQSNDQILASCVAIDNQLEVALAKLVRDKVENDDVKEFADTMIKDHQAFLQKLQRFAPDASREGYLNEQGTSNQRNSRQTTSTSSGVEQAKGTVTAGKPAIQQTNAEQTKAQPNKAPQNQAQSNQAQQNQTAQNHPQQHQAAQRGQPLDFIALHREIAQECLNSAKEELAKKQGAELDECFIGFQIAKHAGMKDKLAVLQRHASSELAQVFAEGAETTDSHLQEAKDIVKKLDRADSKSERQEKRREKKDGEKKD